MNFARENYSDQLTAEMHPLLESHFREIGRYQDIPLDPDWFRYRQLDATGALRIYTARAEGKLRGYAVFFVTPNPHYKSSIQASQDILFLDPSVRGGITAARFIAWCDRQLKGEGVQVVYQHVKESRDFSPLLLRMGYQLADKIYAKRLDQWEAE